MTKKKTPTLFPHEYEYPPGTEFVPIDKWGKDHWGALLYVEGRIVDYKGILYNLHLRCNWRLHRPFAHEGGNAEEYPTRLKGGEELAGHDDWSCLEDAAVAGLVSLRFHLEDGEVFGHGTAKAELTDFGWEILSQAREWRGKGERMLDFEPDLQKAIVRPLAAFNHQMLKAGWSVASQEIVNGSPVFIIWEKGKVRYGCDGRFGTLDDNTLTLAYNMHYYHHRGLLPPDTLPGEAVQGNLFGEV